jgi:holo-[acyl-carrier protein] synthase
MSLVVRTGVDMVKITRIADVVARHGERFLVRVLTREEIIICAGRIPTIAARWAAKEAVAKLLGVGIRGLASGADAIPWHDIQIQRNAVGKPQIVLHGYAATIAAAQGLFSFDISISHDGEYAIASAVAIGLTPGA